MSSRIERVEKLLLRALLIVTREDAVLFSTSKFSDQETVTYIKEMFTIKDGEILAVYNSISNNSLPSILPLEKLDHRTAFLLKNAGMTLLKITRKEFETIPTERFLAIRSALPVTVEEDEEKKQHEEVKETRPENAYVPPALRNSPSPTQKVKKVVETPKKALPPQEELLSLPTKMELDTILLTTQAKSQNVTYQITEKAGNFTSLFKEMNKKTNFVLLYKLFSNNNFVSFATFHKQAPKELNSEINDGDEYVFSVHNPPYSSVPIKAKPFKKTMCITDDSLKLFSLGSFENDFSITQAGGPNTLFDFPAKLPPSHIITFNKKRKCDAKWVSISLIELKV
ncbi:hypothetical protein EIN_152820 [Entamoeba invadens IP1]|uniref:TLDc domain-containing protein n=1 Tax=Entamoeba invadens IP1 TaxID=370355 RepID=A0A0A1U8N1_ENTIV|nr:hypothetical protein EIN_152820 [Entamoeba invadens IP1]ELP91285.1 hypothetical protein EIN_152820 [Entamoeba invadens IP1]|eukprot:XP_004258056.1 hypothetical protein EIN_152820 [Entamoeba invadens IP1]